MTRIYLWARLNSAGLKKNGGIAQLGERLHGMQEVSGSIPLTSTKAGVVQVATDREKDAVPFV